jgi:hypothetical protein
MMRIYLASSDYDLLGYVHLNVSPANLIKGQRRSSVNRTLDFQTIIDDGGFVVGDATFTLQARAVTEGDIERVRRMVEQHGAHVMFYMSSAVSGIISAYAYQANVLTLSFQPDAILA